jgi:hypothetical protein
MQHIIEAYLTRWYLCITTLTRVRSIEVTVHFVKEFLLAGQKEDERLQNTLSLRICRDP